MTPVRALWHDAQGLTKSWHRLLRIEVRFSNQRRTLHTSRRCVSPPVELTCALQSMKKGKEIPLKEAGPNSAASALIFPWVWVGSW